MFNKSIADYDCEKIHLTKHQKSWLKVLAEGYEIGFWKDYDNVHAYIDYGLVDVIEEDQICIRLKINEFGKIYVEYIEEQEKKHKQANFKDWIAIIISIVALIISLMK